MHRSVRSSLARIGRAKDGVASLEFVIILFPLILIFFAVIQVGSIFYYNHQMQVAVRDTARRMIQEPTFNSEKNSGAGGTEVACSATTAGSPEDYGCSIVTMPGPPGITTEYCIDDDDLEHYDAIVTMTVDLDEISLVDLLGVASGKTATRTSTMRVTPNKFDSTEFTDLIPLLSDCS
ncbi:MAG: TadE family protein [Pseudomonadota bacterium]